MIVGDAAPESDRAAQAFRLGQMLDIDFDHFELVENGETWHFPCLIRVERVARDSKAVAFLRETIQSLGGARPMLAVAELSGAGIAEWLIPQLGSGLADIDDGAAVCRQSSRRDTGRFRDSITRF